jgi:hypothetical protein
LNRKPVLGASKGRLNYRSAACVPGKLPKFDLNMDIGWWRPHQ